MRKTTNKAFTLVELIVVITILAILGTIGFMSIKGYTSEANNAKISSDLTTIQRGLETKVAEGGSLMAFVTGWSTNDVSTISLAGTTTNSGPTYQVGNPNYNALGVKQSEFVDPNENEYRIAATTTGGGRIELSAVIMLEWVRTSIVKGSYNPRDTTAYTVSLVNGMIVVLDGAGTNAFKKGDTITLTSGNYVVSSVKRDGITLKLATIPATTDEGWTASLTLAETAGMIADRSSDAVGDVVTNGSETNFAY